MEQRTRRVREAARCAVSPDAERPGRCRRDRRLRLARARARRPRRLRRPRLPRRPLDRARRARRAARRRRRGRAGGAPRRERPLDLHPRRLARRGGARRSRARRAARRRIPARAVRMRRAGDRGWLLDADDPPRLAAAIRRAFPDLAEVVPGHETVLVVGDFTPADLALDEVELPPPREVEIAVTYDGEDLDEVASLTGLSVDDVV